MVHRENEMRDFLPQNPFGIFLVGVGFVTFGFWASLGFSQSPSDKLPKGPVTDRQGRVLPAGKLPEDSRLDALKGERGNFPLVPTSSPNEWTTRKQRVRQIMRVSLGLWPLPQKTPLNPVLHSRRDLGDHTIENVFCESLPGFYLTGNLYRPKGKSGKRPAVLSPHGHFPGGRFIDEGLQVVRAKIAQGAERFEDGGRSFMQARCVQLARMGCVVFHYDMIGYGDSEQIPLELIHRFSRSRVKFKTPPSEGFYSVWAEQQLFNPMGLHTYNSIRALDFLCGLPDVDPQRIAVTGGSGGGTQTFMLCAVDDRPLVSVPVVIVSADRQGGCTCENISGLRIGTTNLDFTALHAPKPLLVISADDASRTMPQRGFPELQQHYRALGSEQNVAHAALLQFPHNYNAVSREAMYSWLNKHLKLGLTEPIRERPYERLTRTELSVWNKSHPPPKFVPGFDQRLLEWFAKDAKQQMDSVAPHDAASLERFRHMVGGAWDILLRGLPKEPNVEFLPKQKREAKTHKELWGLLRYRTIQGDKAELPVVQIVPQQPKKRIVIWLDQRGKAGLFTEEGSLRPPIQDLVKRGSRVIGVDLLYQGEFLRDGKPITRQRSLPGEEAFAGWTYCYNLPVFAQRVHDILATIRLAQTIHPDSKISLVGLKGVGPLAAAAVVQARGAVDRVAIDTGHFRFSNLKDVYDIDFLPGAGKYGDVPALLALAAPTRLWIAGEKDKSLPTVQATYRAAGKSDHLTWNTDSADARSVVTWLLSDKP